VTKHRKLVLLNPLLHQDLRIACGAEVSINCFSNLLDGIKDFGKNAGVKAEKLPTEEESTEIKKEIEALPPFGWSTADESAAMAVARIAQVQRARALFSGVGAVSSLGYVFTPTQGEEGGGHDDISDNHPSQTK
jgi:hypothetical protein